MKLVLVLSALVASAFARPGGCGVRNYGGQGCAYCSDLMNPPESARAYSSTWGHLSNSMLDSANSWSAGAGKSGEWMQTRGGHV